MTSNFNTTLTELVVGMERFAGIIISDLAHEFSTSWDGCQPKQRHHAHLIEKRHGETHYNARQLPAEAEALARKRAALAKPAEAPQTARRPPHPP